MQLALTMCLMAGGLAWIQGMKKDSLAGLIGGTGLLPGGSEAIMSSSDAESQIFGGLNSNARAKQSWAESPLPHLGNTPTLTILHGNADPSGTETECQLRFGEGDEAVKRWLPLGSSSYMRMNAFWYPAGDGHGRCIRLENPLSEYLVDIDKQKTYLLIRYADGVFAGELTENSGGFLTSSSTSPAGEREVHAYVGNNRADDISHTAVAKSPGTHFGVIGRDSSSRQLQFMPVTDIVDTASRK